MAESSPDVVIVGGGIAGLTTAYYLAKARVPSVVVERDAIGSHASGFAYGGLSPLSGFGIPGPLAEIAQDGMRLHRELSGSVVEESGIDVDFRVRSSLALAFTEADVQRLQAALPWQQRQPGYVARWLDIAEARRVEPRISDETLGAALIEGTADVEPYRLVLALTRVAERLGVTVRHGRAVGLRRHGERVRGVVLEREVIACSTVVLALGPWSGEVSAWIDVPIDVRPLKGQILRLKAPGPPVDCSVGWGHNYATTKTDGLLWAGTTEEEAGFDEESTPAARDEIGAALVRMLPAMADAQIAQQKAMSVLLFCGKFNRIVLGGGVAMLGRPVVILLALVVSLAAWSTFAESVDFGSYHALIIGNQAYRNLKSLETPIADAKAVADVLKLDYGFLSVRLLTNATRDEMVRALDELRRTLRSNDNLVVYYAGHGWLDRESDRGYWLPVDAEADSRARWLSNADITDALRALKAKHVLVVADSCYSGTLTRNIGIQPIASSDTLRLAQKRARTALVSGGLEPVADVGGGSHSVFAKAFLNALRGNRGATDLTSLFSAIRREVLLNATQTPEYADIRQAGHDGGDFIFVRPGANLAAAPPRSASTPAPRITPEMVEGYGSLVIRTKLPGIEVWLDDRRLGEPEVDAPLVVNDVAAGTHRLEARKGGRKSWEREVQVARNQRAEVVIDIEPLRTELPKVITGDDGVEMVLVPAGEFEMGSDEADEKPRRTIFLDAFYIDKYEVTNGQFKRFIDATGYERKELWSSAGWEWRGQATVKQPWYLSWRSPEAAQPLYWIDTKWNEPKQPVVGVSWYEADAFCRFSGKRLPTEAEWEKTTRGTDGRKYPWGDLWDWARANAENKAGKTQAVGSHPNGASPYGVQDLAGNVWEWVADWYAPTYDRNADRNPKGPESGRGKVLRGGSWMSYPPFLRSAARYGITPDLRRDDIGFRCTKQLP